jgi:hypothetical protein
MIADDIVLPVDSRSIYPYALDGKHPSVGDALETFSILGVVGDTMERPATPAASLPTKLRRLQFRLYKRGKNLRLGTRHPARRLDGPEIQGRQKPIRQHRLHCSRGKFGAERPYRGNSQPHVGQHSGSCAFSSADPNRPYYIDQDLVSTLVEAPGVSASPILGEDDVLSCSPAAL